MLLNNLKIALRIFTRYKLYGIINMAGLSVAVAFCLLAGLYVKDEFSYDKFHEKGDRIYTMYRMDFKSDDLETEAGFFDVSPRTNVTKGISQFMPLTTLLEERVPEIETLVRSQYNGTVVAKEGRITSEAARYVDKAFFEVFSFDFVYGNPETALSELKSMVVTEEVAIKYFGTTDVLGETLYLGSEEAEGYLISGVIKKPQNSSISLNIVLRFENSFSYQERKDSWVYQSTAVFLLLKEGADRATVEEKIRDIYVERFEERIEGQREMLKLSEANPVVAFGLQNIEDLYLDPTIRFGKSSSPLYSYILIAVGLIILCIACINYASINISLSGARSSEMAIRKVIGSSRGQLTSQFYTESFVVTLAAVLLGYSLMQVCLPLFADVSDKNVVLQPLDHMIILVVCIAAAFVISLLVGVYPARILSKINLVKNLKGNSTHKIKPGLIKGMVVFQFVLCIFFVALGVTMHKQLTYINEKDLGFDKEQVAYIDNAWGTTEQLKQALASEPSIVSSVGLGGIFGAGRSLSSLMSKGVEYEVNNVFSDYDFFETMGVEFISGRGFDPERSRDSEKKLRVVNETLYNIIKTDTLYASMLNDVIGVVKDFHFESLNEEIAPMQFMLREPEFLSMVYVKLNANLVKEGIEAMERSWNSLESGREFEYGFLDDYLNANYKDSVRWGKIIDISAFIAIVIACSGLFGLTGVNIMNRTKELGIRKVLGANHWSLLTLLNKQTIWLILMASAISLPAWLYFTEQWFANYAYHASIGADIFLKAGGICLVIVFLTISFHSLKASRINPVKLLRDN